MSIDSISFGSTDIRGLFLGSVSFDPCSAGRPSITYNGSVLAVIEPVPRTRTWIPTPGIPEFEVTCTPATLPWRPLERVTVGAAFVSNCSALTDDTAPVRFRRSAAPYPIATTGFSSIALLASWTSATACSPSCTVTPTSAAV